MEKSQFWRRAPFSSPFFGENRYFLATRLILVTILRWKSLIFDDETRSRHQFEVKTALFWRRASISSPILGENCLFLTTSPVLVTIFW
ncbi:hypothetical protein NSQ82_14575 [Caldifermentibacillus hisashii]|uniref:hypothetical protein n=1 Tax=Caldifermentibacillus hisashii TaxID=996558 RepID=UPI0031B6E18D